MLLHPQMERKNVAAEFKHHKGDAFARVADLASIAPAGAALVSSGRSIPLRMRGHRRFR